MKFFKQKLNAGFTLVEMIVSLALFAVVVTIAVGALLTLIASNEQLQEEQGVMTNLSFALDSMAREIRTGEHYYCGARDSLTSDMPDGTDNIFNPANDLDAIFSPSDRSRNCPNGNDGNRSYHGIAFMEGGNSITGVGRERILYYYNENEGKIYRRTGVGNDTNQSIVSSGIYISDVRFYVSGAGPLSSNNSNDDQAAVTIFIEAKESETDTKTYKIQTTITQRALDL